MEDLVRRVGLGDGEGFAVLDHAALQSSAPNAFW